jgi:anti-sigma regulatory factor (Ser/Thr protein kinase)
MNAIVVHRRFAGVPASVPAARHLVAETLTGCPRLGDVLQIVSELTANAVEHTDSGLPGHFFAVTVTCTDQVLVEVADDGSAGWPVVRGEQYERPHGRGMLITRELSDGWGFRPAGDGSAGTVVWFVCQLAESSVAAA